MRVLFTWFVLHVIIAVLLSSCSAKSDGNSSESTDNSSTEDISVSSSPSGSSSNNTTIALGQTFQYQVTTTGTYSGTITYSLSNHPEGMTISSSGLIEWTPTEEGQIKTYSNITITITTASGYVLTQTFDLNVSASSSNTISGGAEHNCIVLDNGSVKCWGRAGKLGIDNNTTMGDGPGEMAALPTINLGTGRTAKSITSGAYHNCVVLDDGSAKCWGENSYGQLGIDNSTNMGDGPGEMASLPTINLGTGRTATAISAKRYHTCALLDNGSVKCWGYNNNGQLGIDNRTDMGDNTGEMAQLAGINLGTGRTAIAIAAGDHQSCAVLDDGSVKCWGLNNYGQLGIDNRTYMGDNSSEMASLPSINLGTGRTAKAVSAGLFHTCALLDDGTVKCWGYNLRGQLGIDNTTTMGDGAGEMAQLTGINLGTGRTAISIAARSYHTCALLDDGSVKCWGRNNYGELGIDNTTDMGDGPGEMAQLTGINLGTGRTATSIAIGNTHSCAKLDNGAVKCWGRNNMGQLGIDNTTDMGDDSGEMASLPSVNL